MSQSRALLSQDTLWIKQLIAYCIQQRASDIHIEPKHAQVQVRFRLDGLLRKHVKLQRAQYLQILNCIKTLAKLDIATHHLAQEGQFNFDYNHQTHAIRVSVFPTLYGEKLALRLLSPQLMQQSLAQLGFYSHQLAQYQAALDQPQGLILITGPTGSGKSTTLHTTLNYYDNDALNIVSLEDPIEHINPRITQTPVQAQLGFDYAYALKALLRQDPNIIMIGEIRDASVANIAMQAAQSGHLVFATLHCGTSLAVITRLKNFGLAYSDINNHVQAIVAQRLLRLLCPYCKVMHLDHKYFMCAKANAKGCEHCHQGYAGRQAVFEVLQMTTALKIALHPPSTPIELPVALEQQHFQNLWASGSRLLKEGKTSPEELKRRVPRATNIL